VHHWGCSACTHMPYREGCSVDGRASLIQRRDLNLRMGTRKLVPNVGIEPGTLESKPNALSTKINHSLKLKTIKICVLLIMLIRVVISW